MPKPDDIRLLEFRYRYHYELEPSDRTRFCNEIAMTYDVTASTVRRWLGPIPGRKKRRDSGVMRRQKERAEAREKREDLTKKMLKSGLVEKALSELQFQHLVVQLLWECKDVARVFHTRSETHKGLKGYGRGMPDLLIVLCDGVIVWVELKSHKGEVHEHQKFTISELKALKQYVFLWRPDDWPTIWKIFGDNDREFMTLAEYAKEHIELLLDP